MSEAKAKRAAPAIPPAASASPPAPALPAAIPVVPSPAEIPVVARRRAEAASKDMLAFGRATLAIVAESQAAMARGFEAVALEMTGLARSGIATAGDSATALLGAKTLADAMEAQIGFARRSIDTLIGGTARLTEIGVRLANETTRPILSRVADPAKLMDAAE
jgi:hypothetical protein